MVNTHLAVYDEVWREAYNAVVSAKEHVAHAWLECGIAVEFPYLISAEGGIVAHAACAFLH